MRTSIILIAILLSVTACSRENVESAKNTVAKAADSVTETTTSAIDTAAAWMTPDERKYSKITGRVCKVVDETKEEALAVTGIATGLAGGATAAASAAGVTAVAHSSGAVILTGGAGYIAATLGTAAATTVGVLTAPATIAVATVSLIAVGTAVYICE